jgi:hypothetical protein
VNSNEVSLTLYSRLAHYEGKEEYGCQGKDVMPSPMPTDLLSTHTWTNPNGKKRSVCPWEPWWKV